jgi:hydrogenase maturation factor
MCVSRLHRVIELVAPGMAVVEDTDTSRHRVSLLALDGPDPKPGTWLIVHSGYAIDRVPQVEAEAVLAELRRAEALLASPGDEERAVPPVTRPEPTLADAEGER